MQTPLSQHQQHDCAILRGVAYRQYAPHAPGVQQSAKQRVSKLLRCRSAASSARPSTPENMGLECFFTLPRPRCQPRRPTIKESARQTSHTTRPYPCPVPARISVSVRPHGGAPGFKRYQIGRFSPMCTFTRYFFVLDHFCAVLIDFRIFGLSGPTSETACHQSTINNCSNT